MQQAGDIGPWILASVALVLVAGLAYLAGLRAPQRPPLARPAQLPADRRPIDKPRQDPGASSHDLDLARRMMAIRPAHLCLWVRQDGHDWQPVESPGPASSEQDASRPDEATLQEAVRLRAGENHTRHGWVFRREDVGATDWLLAWRDAAGRSVAHDPAAEESASFSYTVSHDLRAPLRAVDGFTRILKEDYGRQLDRIGNDHLDRVLAAAARMNAMIDAMLSLARLSSQPLARQPVNLSQLAGYIADDLQRSTPARQVRVDIEPDLQATGDPTLLRQVLENLLANAWKYTGRCEQAQIALRCQTVDGRRVFEVSDNGAGFDMRSAERLFGLFQRLHSANEFPGTGVGLASVKRIVLRHGGEIWAESTPGQGARFFFTLAG